MSEPSEAPQLQQTESSDPTPDPLTPKSSPSAPISRSSRGVEHRTFNIQEIYIGRKGCGKSETALRRCLELAKLPAYVVAHDLGWKIPDTLHDGTPTRVKRVSSVAEAREGMRKDPTGIWAISVETCEPVYKFAEEIAAASLAANGGDKGPPCVLYIDEIVTAGICDPHYLDPGFKRLLAEARHRHVGIIAGVQSARILNNQLLTLATKVRLFQVTDRRDHKRLVECGLDDAIVAQAAKLPPHKSIEVEL